MNPKHIRWSVTAIAAAVLITIVQIPIRQSIFADTGPKAQEVKGARQGLKADVGNVKSPALAPTPPTGITVKADVTPPLELKVAHSELTVRVYEPKGFQGTDKIEVAGDVVVVYPDTWQSLAIQHHWDGDSEKGHNVYTITYETRTAGDIPISTATTLSLNHFRTEGLKPASASITPRDDRVRFAKASDVKRAAAIFNSLGLRHARL